MINKFLNMIAAKLNRSVKNAKDSEAGSTADYITSRHGKDILTAFESFIGPNTTDYTTADFDNVYKGRHATYKKGLAKHDKHITSVIKLPAGDYAVFNFTAVEGRLMWR